MSRPRVAASASVSLFALGLVSALMHEVTGWDPWRVLGVLLTFVGAVFWAWVWGYRSAVRDVTAALATDLGLPGKDGGR